jgi:hypothetical protein
MFEPCRYACATRSLPRELADAASRGTRTHPDRAPVRADFACYACACRRKAARHAHTQAIAQNRSNVDTIIDARRYRHWQQNSQATKAFKAVNRPASFASARPAPPRTVRLAVLADGVTACLPGAVLAPAPTPEVAEVGKAPVFVDDSGTRKRLLRIAGVLISLLSVGFLTVLGVALAVPPVTTSVGLGGVVPFIVPGGAAPPPTKAQPARSTRHPGTHRTGSGHPSPSGRQTGGQTPRFDRERAGAENPVASRDLQVFVDEAELTAVVTRCPGCGSGTWAWADRK